MIAFRTRILGTYFLLILLSIVPALPAILLMPEAFRNRYVADIIATESKLEKSIYFFEDLNQNGFSELVFTSVDFAGVYGLSIFENGKAIEQWNLPGVPPAGKVRLMTADWSQDGKHDVFAFSIFRDSLFMHIFDPYNYDKKYVVFIDKVNKFNGLSDILMVHGGVHDMNNDGYPDLVFGICAMYSASPRKVLIYDIFNDSLTSTPNIGAYISRLIVFENPITANKNILVQTNSHCNTKRGSVIFDDHSCWLMVLDPNLEFVIDPVEFPGPFSALTIWPWRQDDEFCFIATHHIYGEQNESSAHYLIRPDGSFITRIPSYSENQKLHLLIHVIDCRGEPKAFLFNKKGELFEILHDLSPGRKIAGGIAIHNSSSIDADMDGKNEIILSNTSNDVLLIYQDFDAKPVSLPLTGLFHDKATISLERRGADHPWLRVNAQNLLYAIEYRKNKYYPLRYLYLAGAVLLSILIVLVIKVLSTRRMENSFRLQRELSNLQISNVLNQLDPHFTFNALNSIGSSIITGVREEAYQQLLRFSALLRASLSDADSVARPLKKELEITHSYLELQKSSYPGRFNYHLTVGEGVNPETPIPRMLLQNHCENALKHGILPGDKPGMLNISVESDRKYLKLVVEDNGIGRQKSGKFASQGTGKGLQLFGRYFEVLNRHNRDKIEQTVIDLHDAQGNPTGTRVMILIPTDYRYYW